MAGDRSRLVGRRRCPENSQLPYFRQSHCPRNNRSSPVGPVVEIMIKELASEGVEMDLNSEKLQDSVKDAVKNAVKEAVREVFEDAEPQEVSKE